MPGRTIDLPMGEAVEDESMLDCRIEADDEDGPAAGPAFSQLGAFASR
jgi:hypothetical protein